MKKLLMQFPAGRMNFDGKTVVADPRKGLVRIFWDDDGLTHFQWLDRVRNVIEHDVIIFPDEAEFKKVTQTSERVYILKFDTDDWKYFFWLQDPEPEYDSALCELVNEEITRPFESKYASATPLIPENILDENIQSRAENTIGSNIGAQINSNVPSTSGPVTLEELQRILSTINSEDAADDPDGD